MCLCAGLRFACIQIHPLLVWRSSLLPIPPPLKMSHCREQGRGRDADSCRKGHQGVGQSMAWPPGCGAPCQVMTIRARFVRGECSLGQPRQGAAGRDKHQLLARRFPNLPLAGAGRGGLSGPEVKNPRPLLTHFLTQLSPRYPTKLPLF